ncbi:MAG: DUF748 domain-containing protein [Planctomycetota bacterium]
MTRRWLRRLAWLAGVVVLLRVALAIAWPLVLDAVLAGAGLEVRYRDMSLSLLAGRVELDGLALVAPDRPDDVLVAVDHGVVDVEWASLLGGRPRLKRVELEGVDVDVRLAPDGASSLLHALQAHAAAAAEEAGGEAVAAAEDDGDRRVSFELPVEVGRLLLQSLRVSVEDTRFAEPVHARVDVELRCEELGAADKDTHLRLQATSADLCESLHVELTGRTGPGLARCSVTAHVAELEPLRIKPWLESLGISPRSREVACDLAAELDLAPLGGADRGSGGTAVLGPVRITTAEGRSFGLERLSAEVAEWSTVGLHVKQVELAELEAAFDVDADARPGMAGFGVTGREAAAPPRGATRPAGDGGGGAADHAVAAVAPPFPIRVDEVRARDLGVTLRDPRHDGDHRLVVSSVLVEGLGLGGVEVEGRHLVELSAPPLLASGRVEGRQRAGADALDVESSLSLTGLDPTALGSALREVGLVPILDRLGLHVGLRAHLAAESDLAVEGLKVVDEKAGETLLGLDRLAVTGLASAGGGTRVGRIALEGLSVPIERDAELRVHALGLRSAGAAALIGGGGSKAPAPPAVEAGYDEARTGGEAFTIGEVSLAGLALRFEDHSPLARPPTTLEGGLSLAGFSTDGRGHFLAPIDLSLQLDAPGFVDRIRGTGTLRPLGGRAAVALDLALEGISGKGVASLSAPEGIEPGFAEAALSCRVEGELSRLGETRLSVKELVLEGDGSERFRLGSLELRQTGLPGAGKGTMDVTLRGTRVGLARGEDGVLQVAGFRLGGEAVAVAEEAAGTATRPEATGEPVTSGPAGREGALPWTAVLADPLPGLGRVVLEDARFELNDASVTPAVRHELSLGAEVGPCDGSRTLRVELGVEDVLRKLTLAGRVGPSSELTLDAEGIAAAGLGAYLPDGVTCTLADGALSGRFVLETGTREDGAGSVEARVEDLVLRDGEREWLSLPRLVAKAPVLDLAGGRYVIQDVSTQGLAVLVEADAEGRSLLGLRLEAPAGEVVPPAPGERRREVARRMKRFEERLAALERLPRVELGGLRLGIDHLVYRANGHEAQGSLVLRTDPDLVLLDEAPSDLPPVALHVEGGLAPAVGSLRVDLSVQPWADIPRLDAGVVLDGIQGTELLALVPSVSEHLEASRIQAGRFEAAASLELLIRRRSPLQFPLADGVGLQLEVRGVKLTDRPDGEVLAGIDDVEVLVEHLRPDPLELYVRSVHVDTLRGSMDLRPEGMSFCGLDLKLPEVPPGGVVPPKPEAPRPGAGATRPAEVAEVHEPGPRPDVRLDSLTVSGIAFTYRDHTLTPSLEVPVEDLEVELTGLDLRPELTGRETTVSLHVDGGRVRLPKRDEAKGLISGVFSTVGGLVSEGPKVYEQRPVFEEIALSGRFRRHPTLAGKLTYEQSAFELQALRGLAKRYGIEIYDGTLDAKVEVRMPGDEKIHVDVRPVFTWLSMSEPEDGPIRRLLQLPTPLDSTLYLLRNAWGEHVVPFSFTLERGQVSAGQVWAIVTKALSAQIVKAVANAPLRVLGSITGIIGLDFTGGGPAAVAPPVELAFEPGATDLVAEAREALAATAEALADDEELVVRIVHELGRQDLAYAERIANPPVEDLVKHATRQREEYKALERRRDIVAQELRTAWALGDDGVTEALRTKLRAVERQIGTLEVARERLFTHLRDSGEGRRAARTRKACEELARARQEAVRALLVELGGEAIAERVTLIRPRFRPDPEADRSRVLVVQRRRPAR